MTALVDSLSARSWPPTRAIDLCRDFMDEWMGGLDPGDGRPEPGGAGRPDGPQTLDWEIFDH
ncbi:MULTISPECIES: hypothetical protein [Actinoplanes]|uniref:hypothetical protein n=1 Tax=Actinoplanes TaxID=1865 RepID=UPI000A64A756|nr:MULTISPECIES: hypothetical protein [Actinoplanes]GLY03999.1 hypothetical protein Acsp01_43780 [Actinoplanes sp. NBRC 101535]